MKRKHGELLKPTSASGEKELAMAAVIARLEEETSNMRADISRRDEKIGILEENLRR